jgi:hypothetical protein
MFAVILIVIFGNFITLYIIIIIICKFRSFQINLSRNQINLNKLG